LREHEHVEEVRLRVEVVHEQMRFLALELDVETGGLAAQGQQFEKSCSEGDQ
jgi:hypothetical protein